MNVFTKINQKCPILHVPTTEDYFSTTWATEYTIKDVNKRIEKE